MASLTDDDKILIKILCLKQGYGAVQMMHEFTARNWSRRTLCNLIKWRKQVNKSSKQSGFYWTTLYITMTVQY